MARYSFAIVSGSPANLGFFAQLRASTRLLRLRKIKLVNTSSSVVAQVALVRSATLGTSSQSGTPGIYGPANTAASTAALDTAWSGAPTVGGSPVHLEHATLAAVVGNGDIWTFPADSEPFEIPPGGGVVLQNISGVNAPSLDMTFVFDE